MTSSNYPASGTGAGHLNEAYNIVNKSDSPNVGRTSTVSIQSGITATTTTANDGGTVNANESRPRNISMMYIIKT